MQYPKIKVGDLVQHRHRNTGDIKKNDPAIVISVELRRTHLTGNPYEDYWVVVSQGSECFGDWLQYWIRIGKL
ncbi:MAG: hypothetical protein CBC29_06170 [Methylococcaceae bacterium TMED69]|nr:MAG: hypothetical protein CBC29_06170 [Methylococcaceae bacterium TMED69]|tara:strand:+ start:981 stop:1199 length:219 start_codon:yes stop_codon:yes gene_type:complete